MKLNLLCSFFSVFRRVTTEKKAFTLTLQVLFTNISMLNVALCILFFFLFMSVSTFMSVLQLSGQFSQRLFRKLPPRVCVPLKNIVSEEFLRAGSVFVCVLIGLLSLCTFPYKVDCSTTCLTHWEPLPVLILIWCIGLVHPYLPVTFMFRMRIYHV